MLGGIYDIFIKKIVFMPEYEYNHQMLPPNAEAEEPSLLCTDYGLWEIILG